MPDEITIKPGESKIFSGESFEMREDGENLIIKPNPECVTCGHPKDQHVTDAICKRTQCNCQGFQEPVE